ncbi:MAG: gliding motility lipoprotein GldH [Bacteroidota bacterium]
MLRNIIIIVFFAAIAMAGCMSSPTYQKEYAIPQHAWQYNDTPSFKFEVTDTTVLYNIYFLVRHTEAYPFSNIWLWVYTKKPGDSTYSKARIEIPLAEPSGKWEGRGMGEIWEQRMPITVTGDPEILRKPGKYEIRFEQNMRMNPLPEILQIGLRVEKAARRTFNTQK